MKERQQPWLRYGIWGLLVVAAGCGSPPPQQRRATAPSDAMAPRELAPRGMPRAVGTASRQAARHTEPRPRAARPGDGKTLKELHGKPQFLVSLPVEAPAPPRGGFGAHSGLTGARSGAAQGRSRLRRVSAEGAITARQVRRVLRAHREEVRRCYRTQGLARQPTLRGSVTVTFSIRADGRVGSARVRSATLGSKQTRACLRTALRRWVFPEGTGLRAGEATWSFQP